MRRDKLAQLLALVGVTAWLAHFLVEHHSVSQQQAFSAVDESLIVRLTQIEKQMTALAQDQKQSRESLNALQQWMQEEKRKTEVQAANPPPPPPPPPTPAPSSTPAPTPPPTIKRRAPKPRQQEKRGSPGPEAEPQGALIRNLPSVSTLTQVKAQWRRPSSLLETGHIMPFINDTCILGDPKDLCVISSSLYGNNPKYSDNALINVRLALELFPGWAYYVYVRPSEKEMLKPQLDALRALGVVIKEPGPLKDAGEMFWRFEPTWDPNVARFISRDLDTRFGVREKAAVDEWIASDRIFHVMRDHPSHRAFPVQGGMWGARRDKFSDMIEAFDKFAKLYGKMYIADMKFLRQVRLSYLIDNCACSR